MVGSVTPTPVNTDLSHVNSDLVQLKQDQGNSTQLKGDLTQLKTDSAQLQGDINGITPNAGIASQISVALGQVQANLTSDLGFPDLAPQGSSEFGDVQTSINRLNTLVNTLQNTPGNQSNLANSLAAFLGLAIDPEALAAALIKQGDDEQKDSLNQQLIANNQAESQDINQASDDMQSASDLRSSAVTSLVVSVVSAAVTIGMSLSAISKTSSTMKDLKDFNPSDEKVGLPKMDEDSTVSSGTEKPEMSEQDFQWRMTNNKLMGDKISNLNNLAQAVSGLGQGLSNYFSQTGQADSQTAQAQGQEDAAIAQQYNSAGDTAKQLDEDVKTTMAAIISFLKDIGDAKVQMMQAITQSR